MKYGLFYVVFVSVVTLASQSASAQSRGLTQQQMGEARTFFEQGIHMADDQRWGEAIEFFKRSLAIVERPSTLFNLGSSYLRVGKPVEAEETLLRFMRVSDPQADAQQRTQAQRLVQEAHGAIATLAVEVTPSAAELRIDDVLVVDSTHPISLDPGSHSLVASATGYAPAREQISVLTGERATRHIDLVVLPAAAIAPAQVARADEPTMRTQPVARPFSESAPEPRSTIWSSPVFWTIVGVVVVGAAVGTVIAVTRSHTSPTDNGSTGMMITALSQAR